MKLRKLSYGDDVFQIQNLPLVPFRRVLQMLPQKDARKMRRLSRWFYERVTFAMPSLFNCYYIKNIRGGKDCAAIIPLLSTAFEVANPPKKLELELNHCEFRPALKKLLLDNKNNITSFKMKFSNFDFDYLLSFKFTFDNLESLELGGRKLGGGKLKTFESILTRHAKLLKHLKLVYFYEYHGNSSKINFPVLQSLDLEGCKLGTDWSLLKGCSQNITVLKIKDCFHDAYQPSNENSQPLDEYKIPCLEHLTIIYTNSLPLNFVNCNAQNLVSLYLEKVGKYPYLEKVGNIPYKVQKCLEFPNLRALNIDSRDYLPILSSCRNKLECLVLCIDRYQFYDYKAIQLAFPRLTDLYLDNTDVNVLREILLRNEKNLEFLLLQCVKIPSIDDCFGLKMEKLRTVILMYDGAYYPEACRNRINIAQLFPNASIIISDGKNWNETRNLIKQRCSRKGFIIGADKFFFRRYTGEIESWIEYDVDSDSESESSESSQSEAESESNENHEI